MPELSSPHQAAEVPTFRNVRSLCIIHPPQRNKRIELFMSNKDIEQRIDAQHILLKAIFDVLTVEQKSEVEEKIKSLSQAARYPHILESFTSPEEAEKAALDLLYLK